MFKVSISSLVLSLSLLSAAVAQDITNIPGMRLWLDAQDNSAFTHTANSIGQWANKVIPANPVIQANGDFQPSISANGLNGRRAAYFDGDDYMTLSSSIRDSAGDYELFIVACPESGGAAWPRFFSSYSGDNGNQWAAPNFIFMAPNDSGTPHAEDAQWYFSEGSNRVLQNIAIASDAKSLGINQFKGYIGEILLFERSLDVIEFETVTNYLISQWGLPSPYQGPTNVSLEPRLRDLGDALGLPIGSITRDDFFNFEETQLYQDTLGQNYGILTTGNAAKYGPLSTGQGTYDFSTLDKHLAVADKYKMQFHGHVFIWHNQTPNWLESGTWTRQELIDILNDHIDQVGGYLKGKVDIWDVVNEPFLGDGTWRTESIWNSVIDAANSSTNQRDFIDLAFQRARQVDPDATLILNDFSVAVINDKSDAMYTWAQSMVNRGIPLDGIGFQMHIDGPIDYDSFAQNMQRFADLGLEIHITELDVKQAIPFTTAKSMVQAEVYRNVVRKVLEQPAAKTFTMWGFTDAHSWIPTHSPGYDSALIFDKEYQPKHAFVALQEELINHLTTDGLKTRLLGQVASTPEADLEKDLDHDGLSTFFEIAMKSDPAEPNFDSLPPVQVSPGSTKIGFTPRPITTDIEIRVEVSIDLQTWETAVSRQAGASEWNTIREDSSLIVDESTGEVSVSLDNLEVGTFVRLRVIQTS